LQIDVVEKLRSEPRLEEEVRKKPPNHPPENYLLNYYAAPKSNVEEVLKVIFDLRMGKKNGVPLKHHHHHHLGTPTFMCKITSLPSHLKIEPQVWFHSFF
jgi:hypothetical protein